MEKLGEYLDRLMRQKNLTPKELSKRSGLTDSYIGRLRKGRSDNLTVQTVKKLAMALDVNAHEIFAAATGIPASEFPQIDGRLLLDQMLKLIREAHGFDLLQQWLDFSPDERKTLLDYMEYIKRPPSNGKSGKKGKPRKK
ncbi:MAG TPA: helix-turn-helix transcriptional regulator [Blastocatellia bacterium]|nr:helix-turn-helix transcriptional regulator [Blastocatellia bacterium]